jgi:hypothetical protein
MDRLKRAVSVFDWVARAHFGWLSLGVSGVAATIVTAVGYFFANLPWPLLVTLFVSMSLVGVALLGYGRQVWLRAHPGGWTERLTTSDTIEAKVIRPTREELAERVERYRTAAIAYVTWLYRRSGWHGLSEDQRLRDAAPSTTWGRQTFADAGLDADWYDEKRVVAAEKGFHPSRWPPEERELHDQGQQLIDDLSGSRYSSQAARQNIEERYRNWDRACEQMAMRFYGTHVWESFETASGQPMDDGELHFAQVDPRWPEAGFPEWVPDLANRIRARMARIRLLVRGGRKKLI